MYLAAAELHWADCDGGGVVQSELPTDDMISGEQRYITSPRTDVNISWRCERLATFTWLTSQNQMMSDIFTLFLLMLLVLLSGAII